MHHVSTYVAAGGGWVTQCMCGSNKAHADRAAAEAFADKHAGKH